MEMDEAPTTATDSMPHRFPRNYCNRFDAAFVTRNEKSVRICKIIYFTSYLLFRNFYIPSGSAMQAPGKLNDKCLDFMRLRCRIRHEKWEVCDKEWRPLTKLNDKGLDFMRLRCRIRHEKWEVCKETIKVCKDFKGWYLQDQQCRLQEWYHRCLPWHLDRIFSTEVSTLKRPLMNCTKSETNEYRTAVWGV